MVVAHREPFYVFSIPMNAETPVIAIGLEFPIALRGGVSVLVEELLHGLSDRYRIVLVSRDRSDALPASVKPCIAEHIEWNPLTVSRATSSALAGRLAGLGVRIAHLHSGGNYGWGNRLPGQSPILFLNKRGIACFSTIHLVVSIFDGYCDAKKPVWFKAALLPVAWLGKMQTLRHLRKELVVSKHGCERVRKWYWPLRDRFVAVYHSRLKTAAQPAPRADRELVILCVGHIAFRKGQLVLVEAFARIAEKHPRWNLLLLGDILEQSCADAIARIIREKKLQDRIQLAGPRDDAMEFMQRAAVFVQPSFFEGLPLALQEAMFCGCACVATRISGNTELVDDEKNGLLVAPGDVAEMAGALDRIISDPEARKMFGRASAVSILDCGMTAEQMIARHCELYDSPLATA